MDRNHSVCVSDMLSGKFIIVIFGIIILCILKHWRLVTVNLQLCSFSHLNRRHCFHPKKASLTPNRMWHATIVPGWNIFALHDKQKIPNNCKFILRLHEQEHILLSFIGIISLYFLLVVITFFFLPTDSIIWHSVIRFSRSILLDSCHPCFKQRYRYKFLYFNVYVKNIYYQDACMFLWWYF